MKEVKDRETFVKKLHMRWSLILSLLLVTALMFSVACDGEDRPGEVKEISSSGSGSGSDSGSGSGSDSNSGTGGSSGEATAAFGGYTPASDVSSHAKVCLDVDEINNLLPKDAAIDYAAIKDIYQNGKHSVKSSGSVRTIGGFAQSERDEAIWNDYVSYYGDSTWLNTFVMSAIDGTGAFAGESDLVRRQGIQKGIMNQVMMAWTIHELVVAAEKSADGNVDPAKGAPHNWDEAWAFYHGDSPGDCPFATADKRGKDFGTGSTVNDTVLTYMNYGLAHISEPRFQDVADQTFDVMLIPYIQATIKYALKIDSDIAGGDMDAARIHQAEGWAFYRVIEPILAKSDAASAKRIGSILDLSQSQPSAAGREITAILMSHLDAFNVSAEQIGSYEGSGDMAGSGSGSGSNSGTSDSSAEASGPMGGYTPVSDVSSHAKVCLDVDEINNLLPKDAAIDYAAIKDIYQNGKHSVKSSGSVRTIGGFATSNRDEAIWNDYVSYYGDENWLNTFAMSAIDGTGAFAGEADLVRRQGIQKGIMNQIMMAWTIHELVVAAEKSADGNIDPASGAPHNWDEAWAFYHGDSSGDCPFATADKRGKDFGTGSTVNDTVLANMQYGLTHMGEPRLQGVADQTIDVMLIPYIQASIKYALKVDSDIADGDMDAARIHQAEGWAFYRVIEPILAKADAASAKRIGSIFDLSQSQPSAAGAEIKAILMSNLDAFNVSAEQIGSYD